MKIYNDAPRKIGQNLVIQDSTMVNNNSMFLAIPPKSDLYRKLGDEFGMYLIKTGNNKMVFRSKDPLSCGEFGQNHLDLNLNYNKNVNFDLSLFRLICANGLEGWETIGSFQFKNVLQNKIDTSLLIQRLQKQFDKTEKRLEKIQEVELVEDEQQFVVDEFLKELSTPTSHRYLRDYDKMKQQDINHMLKLLSSNDLTKPNRIEDFGTNLWTTYNTIQENTTKIVKQFKPVTKLENRILLDTIKPLYA